MPLELAKKPPPQLPSRWKVTAAKIVEKFGHKAALTEIVEKIHAEIEKKKKKAARRGALGYWGHLGLWVKEGVWDVWAQHK